MKANSSDRKEQTLIEHVLAFLSASERGESLPTGTIAEKLYLQTAREIRDFLEEIPGGFLIYRADDNESLVYANKALLHIFACDTFEEFRKYTGNSFKGLVHPEDLDAVEQSIVNQISASHNNLDYVEYRIKDKNGNVRWIEDYGHFVHDDTVGDIYYVFLTDATEKKLGTLRERARLIDQRNEREKKIKTLIEEYDKERQIINREHLRRLEVIEGLSANYESILYVDFASDDVFPYRLSTRIVKQFEGKFVSRPYKWFAKDYVKTWVHPDDRAVIAEFMDPEYMRKKLVEVNTYYANFRCIKDGKTFYLQIRAVNVGESYDGLASQAVIGYRNVDDEIKREIEHTRVLEQTLRDARRAEAVKNTFLSNMSHDMRTPLNAVFGFAELAKKNLTDPDALKMYIEKIETAGEQILELVDKVLELTYTETKSSDIRETPCNIRDIVDATVGAVSLAAERKGLELSVTTDIKNDSVTTDAEKLTRALTHIVSNAVTYTDKGKVWVTVTQAEGVGDFSEYTFAVKDTGCGISPEALVHIFEPFERERNTTSSGIFGAGLGLTIAKNTVELLGGTITAESEQGKGSLFTVRLKLHTQKTRSEKFDAQKILKSLVGAKILIVEDNEINLEIETELLEELGFEVDCAENGAVAVQKFSDQTEGTFTAVLMDIQMPVMDGRQAAEKIRALGSDIPIIALSANALESDKKLSLEAGMDAHLTKPIDVPLLMQTLAGAIARRNVK